MKKIKAFVAANKDVLAVFVCMLVIFYVIMYYMISDLPLHAGIAREKLREHGLLRGNFLFYLMANFLAGFAGYLTPIKLAIVFLLALANTIKYAVVRDEFSRRYSLCQSRFFSLALLVVFIIPVLYVLDKMNCLPKEGGYWDYMYCNLMYWYYVPNVWHNSTVIFLMPFAIVSYFLSVRQFESFDKKRNGWITLFVVVGTLVKPSFFFIYFLAYFVMMFARYRFSKEFFLSLFPLFAGCLCVLYVYLSVFEGSDDNQVAISVMPVINHWKPYALFFVISMAFPVVFSLCYRKEIIKDKEFWFVLMMLIVAVGIYWCCHETGSRADHGNFWWQTVVTMWFVYYYMLKVIIKSDNPFDAENKAVNLSTMSSRGKAFVCLYGAHVVMGAVYLIKFFVVGIYY